MAIEYLVHEKEAERHPEPFGRPFDGPMAGHNALQEAVRRTGGGARVECTHGDVIGDILRQLGRDGARLDSERCQKGSIWVLETVGDGRIRGSYLPPAR